MNLVFGIFALGFGLVTLVGRFVAPNSPALFGKLAPMKERWGDGAGTALHWFAYTVMPLLLGTVLLGAALMT